MRFLRLLIMISCMNNILIRLSTILVFIISGNFYTLSQTTYYYKLVRAIENGKNSTNVQGGQFITFVNNLCYESDCKGKSVGHGQLHKVRDTNSSQLTFKGNGYWGNSEYIFDSSKQYLNIITSTGSKYVFRRDNQPKGIITCSYIRDNSNATITPNPSVFYPTINSNSNSDSPAQRNTNDHEQRKREILNKTYGDKCKSCNGTGKCHACNGTKIAHGFGNSFRCNVCNENGDCSVCQGTGKTSWNR